MRRRGMTIVLLGCIITGLCACGRKNEAVTLQVVTEAVYKEQVSEAADYFRKKYEGVEVEVQVLPIEAKEREAKVQKLRTETMSGKGPDVFLLQGDLPNREETESLFASLPKTMESGVFAGLDKYMEQDVYWEEGSYKKEFLKAGQFQGRQYVIPLSCNYDVFAKTAEGTLLTAGTLTQWFADAKAAEDEELRQVIAAGTLMLTSPGLCQPAVDYEKKEVLFDKNAWCGIVEEQLEIYRKRIESDVVDTGKYFVGNIAQCNSYFTAGADYMEAIPSASGQRLATVDAYGAVGMGCKEKELAYEFLMLFLNDKMVEKLGADYTRVKGMLGIDGVPVQESAWKEYLGNYNLTDEAVYEKVLFSFQQLDGAYFSTVVERKMTNGVQEMVNRLRELDDARLSQQLALLAGQLEEQYGTLVKE
ncbi:hypothetical protein ABXS75_19530 [Roseburia hominis]